MGDLHKLKPTYFIIASAVLIILGVFAFFRMNEDVWICTNGSWVKHGNPSAAMPTTGCGDSNSGVANTNGVVNTNSVANVNATVNGNTNTTSIENSVVNGNTNTAVDPTAGWKTYTNTELGFSIKFPTTWEGYTVGSVVNSSIKFTHPKKVSSKGNPGEVSFIITRLNKGTATPSASTLVKENDLYKFVFSPSNAAAPDEMNALWEQIPTIISTFDFVDPTIGWKTYTNTAYHYFIKYPTNWSVKENIGTYPDGNQYNFVSITETSGNIIYIGQKNAVPITTDLPYKIITTEQSTISGKPVTKKTYIPDPPSGGSYSGAEKIFRYTFTTTPTEWGKDSAIDLHNAKGDEVSTTLLSSILSTFAFTN